MPNEHKEDQTAGNGSIGNVEDPPPLENNAPEMDVGNVHVEKVHHTAVEQWRLAIEDAVEDAVNHVADRTGQDECDCELNLPSDALLMHPAQKHREHDCCNDGKKAQRNFRCAEFDAERHARIFDERNADCITDERERFPDAHAGMLDTQERKPLHRKLCRLIEEDDPKDDCSGPPAFHGRASSCFRMRCAWT